MSAVVESGPGGGAGCRAKRVREYAQPSLDSPTPLSIEDARAAPELDPGRMAYVFNAGDAGGLTLTPAEVELAEAHWELERAAVLMEEAVTEAGIKSVATWIDEDVVIVSTTQDPTVVEDLLSEFTVQFDVVQVDFRVPQLERWARSITVRVAVNEPLLVNIDTIRNVIVVQISPEASLNLAGIPCIAVELVFDR